MSKIKQYDFVKGLQKNQKADKGQYDFLSLPTQELSLDELRKRNSEQVKKQIEEQTQEPIKINIPPIGNMAIDIANNPLTQKVADVIAEPFKTISKGMTQLVGTGGEVGIPPQIGLTANPVAGAINLATGIAELPMLIGTVPLSILNGALDEIGLQSITKPINKAFQTIQEAPSNAAQEITDALEKHGTATKIRNFVDNLTGEKLRINPQVAGETKEAANNLTGLAAIVGVAALGTSVFKGLKENIKVQSELKDLGYTSKQVQSMKPEEAYRVLSENTKKELLAQSEKETELRNNINQQTEQTNVQQIGQTLNIKNPEIFNKSLEETKNAVQKQSTNEVDVRKQSDNGEKVGGTYTESKITPEESQVKKEVIDNNAKAIEQLTSQGKTPEDISKALNVPVDEVKSKIVEQSAEILTEKTSQKLNFKEPEKLSDIPPDNIIDEKLAQSKEPPETISITKAKMNDLRESVGLPELEKTARQAIPDTYEKVKTEIDNGIRNEQNLINDISNGKHGLDSSQSFEAAYYLTKESNRWNVIFDKIKQARKEGDVSTETMLQALADESLTKMKDLTNAVSNVTSDWGRFGRFMQVQLANDYSIARTMQRAEMYAPEGKIPVETKTKLENLSSDLAKLQEAYNKFKVEQPSKNIEDFIKNAQRKNDIERRRGIRAVTKDELKKERESLWVDLYKQTNVAAAGIPLTPEAIKTMGKLATNYVKEGIITVEGLVDEFYNGFKGQISKEDIMKAISGYGKQAQMTKDEVRINLNKAKQEMKLLLAIEDVKKGNQPFKKEINRTEPNEKVKGLQRLLNSLTKENVDISDAIKLKSQKTRVKNNIIDYERRLNEKDFSFKKRQSIIPDEELTNLKIKEHQLKKQIELELYRVQRLNMTKWDKTKELIGGLINVPRSLLATADLSMVLRQALPATVSEPLLAYQAFKEMHKAAVSSKYFDKIMTEIEIHPYARIMEKMGIQYTGTGADLVSLAKKEEAFIASHILNKIPGLKTITEFSERGAVAFTNRMRFLQATKQIDYLMSKGLTPENNLKVYKDIGDVINWSTGRSDIGALERIPGTINAILFSPRNLVAKLQYFNPKNYITMETPARKLLTKQMIATIAQGVGLANMMNVMGAKIETDPRSADFMKGRFGNTRIDMFGGFQQIAVFLARLGSGSAKSSETGNVMPLDNSKFPFTNRADLILRFLRSKLSPQASFGVNALAGKDMMGEEFGKDVPSTIWNTFVPMVLQDTFDAQKELGWGALGVGLLGFYGAGTQTYASREKKSKGSNFNFDVNFNFAQ